MSEPASRVVLLSLDGCNHRTISLETTPRLCALRDSGGWAPEGGRCDVPSVTYVSHATLATGTLPATHGLTSNMASAPRPGVVPGWAGEVDLRAPTIFDALHAGGVRSAAVCGDQNLVRLMGAAAADVVWPPGGVVPDGVPLCAAGYVTNDAVRDPLLAAAGDRELPFFFGHLNETDTWGHRFGPDHAETLRSLAGADALVGEVIDALQPDWERTLVIVLSDHGMEEAASAEAIDLMAGEAVRAVIAEVVDEGGAALAKVREGVLTDAAGAALAAVPGVASWREVRPGVILVEGAPGALFAAGFTKMVRGVHGGPGATVTLAIVGGGHPAVPRIAAAIAERPPHLGDWAPTIAAVLGVEMPTAEGRNLGG
jgi:hypothetical protein